jgi:hypothetical protein
MFPGLDMGGGWHVSFGIGAFPFTFFSTVSEKCFLCLFQEVLQLLYKTLEHVLVN